MLPIDFLTIPPFPPSHPPPASWCTALLSSGGEETETGVVSAENGSSGGCPVARSTLSLDGIFVINVLGSSFHIAGIDSCATLRTTVKLGLLLQP